MLQRKSWVSHPRHRQATAALQHRPQVQHRPQYVPQAASNAGETDEPGISKKDMGIVFSQQLGNTDEQVEFPLTVPLLPFQVEEVLLPGSVKTLHLFEARYLALLEEVLSSPKSNKLFGHVVVEQPGDPVGSKASAFPGAYVGENFVFLMGTLVRVLEVKSLQVGALVRIQAEARISVHQVRHVDPYIRATVALLPDEPLQDRQRVHSQVQQLTATMQDLQNLAQKFRTKQTAALQQAMYWWEKKPLIPATASSSSCSSDGSSSSSSSVGDPTSSSRSSGMDAEAATAGQDGGVATTSTTTAGSSSSSSSGGDMEAATAGEDGGSESPDLAERAARLSFAALQCTPEASPMEQLKLLRCCVNAMETSNTSERLKLVQNHMQESQKLLAAKVAIKALQLG